MFMQRYWPIYPVGFALSERGVEMRVCVLEKADEMPHRCTQRQKKILPAVGRGDDQSVADAGSPETAAQLAEQPVGQRLQREHDQQRAEEEAVGRLHREKTAPQSHFLP